jgi:hypothetical protein
LLFRLSDCGYLRHIRRIPQSLRFIGLIHIQTFGLCSRIYCERPSFLINLVKSVVKKEYPAFRPVLHLSDAIMFPAGLGGVCD